MNKKVCVYMDYNPTTNKPFYVGIGNKTRLHCKVRNRYHSKIRNTLPDKEFDRVIIHEDIDIDDAFEIEKQLIKTYGRLCNNTGILANIHPGGPIHDTDPKTPHWTKGRTMKEIYGEDWESPRIGKSYEEQYGDRKDDIIRRQTKFRIKAVLDRHKKEGLSDKEKQRAQTLSERRLSGNLTQAEKEAYKQTSKRQKGKTMQERLNDPNYVDPRKGKKLSQEERDKQSKFNNIAFKINNVLYNNQKEFLDKTGFRYGYLSRLRQLGQITINKDQGIFKKGTTLIYES